MLVSHASKICANHSRCRRIRYGLPHLYRGTRGQHRVRPRCGQSLHRSTQLANWLRAEGRYQCSTTPGSGSAVSTDCGLLFPGIRARSVLAAKRRSHVAVGVNPRKEDPDYRFGAAQRRHSCEPVPPCRAGRVRPKRRTPGADAAWLEKFRRSAAEEGPATTNPKRKRGRTGADVPPLGLPGWTRV